MGTQFANGKIVTDGLVLALDAADRNSYISGSSVWNDVSGNNKNFVFDASGMTYNSNGYFSLTEAGGMTCNSSITTSSDCTFVFWIKSTDTRALFLSGQGAGAYYFAAYAPENKFYNSNSGTPTLFLNSASYPNIFDYFPNGNWYMVEFKGVDLSLWTSANFNKYTIAPQYNFSNGFLSNIYAYNRSLSQQESIQNYNALKSRFGLK